MNLVSSGPDTAKTVSGYKHPSTRSFGARLILAAALSVVCISIVGVAAAQRSGNPPHWVASWVTSPAAYFVYAPPVAQNQALGASPTKYAVATIQPDLKFPFPNANSTGASNQTIRSIVKPDLWSNSIRIRLSNVFGDQPLTFNAVTVALQEYAANLVKETITPVSFNGSKSLTIPPGQEVWSDAIRLSWVKNSADPLLQGRNLAISYSIQGNSGHMTYHAAANTTSFITPSGSGNHTGDVDGFAYDYTTTSWFFLTAVDVTATRATSSR